MFSFLKPFFEIIKQALPFIVCAIIFLFFHLWQQSKKDLENAETVANFSESHFAVSKELLKLQLENKWNDSILTANGYKPKNVQSITNIHYHKTEIVNKDSVVTVTDSTVCVDYVHKGWSLKGCNGTYTDDRDLKATGFVINQPTKKFLGIIPYRKKPILKAWTSYGDSINVTLVTKPQ
jgi:hypothetical protein